MKFQTSALEGRTLDWAVGAARNKFAAESLKKGESTDTFYFTEHASVDMVQGGRIIEQEKISLKFIDGAWWSNQMQGPTFLIAAMRGFVASKLGDEVEIGDGMFEIADYLDKHRFSWEKIYRSNCVKTYRRKKRITQTKLAELVGTSLEQIQGLETGKSPVQLDVGTRISEALHVPLGVLFPVETVSS